MMAALGLVSPAFGNCLPDLGHLHPYMYAWSFGTPLGLSRYSVRTFAHALRCILLLFSVRVIPVGKWRLGHPSVKRGHKP